MHLFANISTRNRLISMAIKMLFLCDTGICSKSIVTLINSIFYYRWTAVYVLYDRFRIKVR